MQVYVEWAGSRDVRDADIDTMISTLQHWFDIRCMICTVMTVMLVDGCE